VLIAVEEFYGGTALIPVVIAYLLILLWLGFMASRRRRNEQPEPAEQAGAISVDTGTGEAVATLQSTRDRQSFARTPNQNGAATCPAQLPGRRPAMNSSAPKPANKE
jgi:hypothetical protein